MTPATADLEHLVERRFRQFREVRGLVQWRLPIGGGLAAADRGGPAVDRRTDRLGAGLAGRGGGGPARCDGRRAGPRRAPGGRRVGSGGRAATGLPHPVDRHRRGGRLRGRCADPDPRGVPPGPGRAAVPGHRPAGQRPGRGDRAVRRRGAGGGGGGPGQPDSDWHPRTWTRADCADGLAFASAEAATSWLAGHPGHITVAMELFVRTEGMLHARLLAEAHRLPGGGERGAADHR